MLATRVFLVCVSLCTLYICLYFYGIGIDDKQSVQAKKK